ncbi:GTPase [Candidatus Woesearchaeota archaeon CG10_big_fil_rev_8_21_14_0_10_36_11]|nr:MAG: GTPase [Candidatus Woesearchaeota archaeon CG10_big_fil_rev_8_21_14_0_10_36_11]
MPSFWKHVNKVLREAEIIIEVLDARMIDDTRNVEIERKIEQFGKKILYVINKCDLVDTHTLEPLKRILVPSVFISSKDRLGTTILKKKILELSRGNPVTVGVLGYPNVGKSSLINALAGKGAARTSSESGYTKGVQKIRVDNKILILDTPGVFPQREKDLVKHGMTGSLSYEKIKDPEIVALELISEKKVMIQKKYNVTEDDPDEILGAIAVRYKLVLSGNKPNMDAAARKVLKDWQTGKIK